MIFIPFNVPSSKNSKIATKRGVFHSKTVQKYLRELGIQHYSVSKKEVKEYVNKPNLFRIVFEENNWVKPSEGAPIKLGLFFHRSSKRKADFHNLCQIIFDLMVAHDFLEDDDMEHLLPYPMDDFDGNLGYKIDKDNPGVYIKILK